jgi:hypothetical protein
MKTLNCIILLLVLVTVSCGNPTDKGGSASQPTTTSLDLGTISLDVPAGWERINDDTLPKVADMTARYMLYTPTGDTVFIWHGNSTWDFSEENEDYTKVRDTFPGFNAFKIRPQKGKDGYVQFFIDSVGTFKPTGKYGLSIHARHLSPAMEDTFWKVVHTIKVRPF